MKRKILVYLLFLAAFTGVLTSCIDEEFEELGTAGDTFVKIQQQPQFFFSPFNTVKKIDGFSIRRDANSNEALLKSTTVRIVADAAAIPAGFELLPESYYTLESSTGIQKSGNAYTIPFNSGDFAKEFTIKIDGSKWTDLSKKYALAFKIEDAGGLKIANGQDKAVAKFAIKNKYDGKYEITGTMKDVVVTTLTGAYPIKAELHTLTENSVVLYDVEYFANYFHAILSNGSPSGYGGFAPIFTMDANGNVISVTNYYGQPAGNGRSAKLDPSGVNKFTVDEAKGTKTLEVSYILHHTTQGDRTFFNETFTYKGSR